jgi:DNA-binding response OmpR family regulator
MADILVIDDEDALRRLIARILRGAGHAVREATGIKEAVAHFDARTPALLITDIVLPAQEGIETIIELRREMPDIPILAIAGGAGSVHPSLAKGGGAIGSLGKPFSGDELLNAVTKLLGGPTA